VRKLGVVAMMAMTLMLAACTSSTALVATKAKAASVVPWVDEPATQSLISSLLTPLPLPRPRTGAPPCAASDLAETGLGTGAATQELVVTISFRNTGSAACTLKGTPRVVAAAPGQPTVVAVAEPVPSYGEMGDVAPAATVSVLVEDQLACVANPGGNDQGDAGYHSLVISVPGGITKKVSGLSLVFPCGMSATPFFIAKPEATYPLARFIGLVPHLLLPATAKAGSTLHFEVDLVNSAGRPVALSPCPVYLEASNVPTKLLYRLDCRTVRSIPAHGQVRYEMEMSIPDAAPPGPAKIFWDIIGASTTTAQGQVQVQ
jgi:hypothetical protein